MDTKFYTKLFKDKPIKQSKTDSFDLLCIEETIDRENFDVQIEQSNEAYFVKCKQDENPLLVVIFKKNILKYELIQILIRFNNNNFYTIFIDEEDLMTSKVTQKVNQINTD